MSLPAGCLDFWLIIKYNAISWEPTAINTLMKAHQGQTGRNKHSVIQGGVGKHIQGWYCTKYIPTDSLHMRVQDTQSFEMNVTHKALLAWLFIVSGHKQRCSVCCTQPYQCGLHNSAWFIDRHALFYHTISICHWDQMADQQDMSPGCHCWGYFLGGHLVGTNWWNLWLPHLQMT